ncbi:Methylglutaconyl-CoA hydratase, mitochondrial [Toxocara canis]|uniref:Methylglutaconyl-CoA hydratase, mitochondrial n=1 Tax=Toxocara canis TaxID=6265 RepID=A0A0B2VZI6_TOXCA|nr:Methylglutaconyl-CoA hydratase, mitochondrial [Toxocara canis]
MTSTILRSTLAGIASVRWHHVAAIRYSTITGSSSHTPHEEPLIVDRLSGSHDGVVVLRINRPESKNAINKHLLEMFKSTVESLKYDKQTRVVIIKSDAKGAFCTGADLKQIRSMPEQEVPKFVENIRELIEDVAALPMPVIAVIDGYALGGGLEIALACDIRIASASSKLGLVETKLAVIPGAGGTQRMPRTIGISLAKELIFSGRMLSGTEAATIGLVSYAVDDHAFDKALQIAEEILPRGPFAVKAAKSAIDHGFEIDLTNGLLLEKEYYTMTMQTKDRLEGLKAFLEKRKPNFKGE